MKEKITLVDQKITAKTHNIVSYFERRWWKIRLCCFGYESEQFDLGELA